MKLNRAFYYWFNYKRGLFGKKVKSITISDGTNDLELEPHEIFIIDTDKHLDQPVIRRSNK